MFRELNCKLYHILEKNVMGRKKITLIYIVNCVMAYAKGLNTCVMKTKINGMVAADHYYKICKLEILHSFSSS